MQRRSIMRAALGLGAAVVIAAAIVAAGLLRPVKEPVSAAVNRIEAQRASRPSATALGSKLVALHAIERDVIGAVEPPTEYWREDVERLREDVEASIAAHRRARGMLVAEYGERAADDPAFRSLFRPLDRRLPFMTSAQQIAVLEAELRLQSTPARTADGGSRTHAFDRHLEDLAATIGEAASFEYALRASPLSHDLRSARIELDETEFRGAYALLARLATNALSPSDYYDARRALRSLLGTDRFTLLSATRDPRFPELARVGRRFSLDDDTLMSAYRIINDSQDALLAAGLNAPSDDTSSAPRLRELYDASRTRLAELVGAEAASAMLTAFSMPPDRPSRRFM